MIDKLLNFRSSLDDIIGKFQGRKAALESIAEVQFNALNSDVEEQEA